jgi:hypothetical protein
LRVAERGAVDADGVALVAEAAEQRVDECLVAEEVVPLLVGQPRRVADAVAPANAVRAGYESVAPSALSSSWPRTRLPLQDA